MVVGEFPLDPVPGSSHAGAVRVPALDHESGDDAVEDDAVIEAAVGQMDEVLDRVGGGFGIELHLDDASVLHGDRCDGRVAGHVWFLLDFLCFGFRFFRGGFRLRGGFFRCGGSGGLLRLCRTFSAPGRGHGQEQADREDQDLFHRMMHSFVSVSRFRPDPGNPMFSIPETGPASNGFTAGGAGPVRG